MSPEENKAVVQRFYAIVEDVFRTGDTEALDEVLAPELVYSPAGGSTGSAKLQTLFLHAPHRLP